MSAITIHVQQKYRLHIEAIDAAGLATLIPPGVLTWVSSDPTIASVTAPVSPLRGGSEILQGLKEGTVTVMATLTKPDGTTLTGSIPVTVIAADAVGLVIKAQ